MCVCEDLTINNTRKEMWRAAEATAAASYKKEKEREWDGGVLCRKQESPAGAQSSPEALKYVFYVRCQSSGPVTD